MRNVKEIQEKKLYHKEIGKPIIMKVIVTWKSGRHVVLTDIGRALYPLCNFNCIIWYRGQIKKLTIIVNYQFRNEL